MAISPDGNTLYTNSGGGIVPIDTATHALGTPIPASGVPVICSNGNALLASGLTFKANTSGALVCTMASGPTGSPGPVFTGGTLRFVGANIASALPIALMAAGGTFDTFGNNATLSGAITGPGSFTKTGLGTLTLSGSSTYSGATFVNAGTLQAGAVNAFSPFSAYLVASGATLDLNGFSQSIGGLSGIGSVANNGGGNPTLTIGAGGFFAPGAGTPGSSMTIPANLAFQSGAMYLVQINPSTSSFATVLGTATLNGAGVSVNFAPGSYALRRYTILTATGGITDTFGSVSGVGGPLNIRPTLNYDANNVFLDLALSYAIPGLNGNQQAVGNALTNFFNSAGSIPAVYTNLSSGALLQAAGETATGSQQNTFNAMTQFMGVMMDPFVDGRGGVSSTPPGAPGFADEGDQAMSHAAGKGSNAYAMLAKAPFTKATPADPFAQRWSVWAAAFGGAQTTDGNAASGSSSATSRLYGTAVGADYRFSPFTLAGIALAGGGTIFAVNNFGSGRSDLFQAGAYLRHTIGATYISGALAYGWQDITTNRTVTIAGIDQLQAHFNANAYSGRVEGGHRFVIPWAAGIGITPYAAAQFTTFNLPAYAESVVSGTNNFALAYGSQRTTDSRSELGIRTDKSFAMPDSVLTLRGRLAWSHDFNPDRAISATFQALPAASFVVNGAAQASEAALTTASVERKWINGFSLAGTFEGEFSSVTRSYAGKAVARYQW